MNYHLGILLTRSLYCLDFHNVFVDLKTIKQTWSKYCPLNHPRARSVSISPKMKIEVDGNKASNGLYWVIQLAFVHLVTIERGLNFALNLRAFVVRGIHHPAAQNDPIVDESEEIIELGNGKLENEYIADLGNKLEVVDLLPEATSVGHRVTHVPHRGTF